MARSKTTHRRRLVMVAALLVLAAAATLWLLRDLPRSRVERALSTRLGAEVTLGGLALEGRDRVRLDRVELSSGAGSALRHLFIDRITAEGAITGMADGQFRSLVFSGMRTRVDACSGEPATDTPSGGDVVVGELQIEDAEVEVLCGERVLPVALSGTLLELGGAPHGRFELRTAPLEPLAVAAGVRLAADALAAQLTLNPNGDAALHATVQGALLLGRTELALGDPELELTLEPRSSGGWSVTASSSAPLLGSPVLHAEVDRMPWRIHQLELEAESLAAGALLSAVAPVAGLELGAADVKLSGKTLDRIEVALNLPAAELSAAGQALHVSGTVTGHIAPSKPAPTGSLRAELSISDDEQSAGRLHAVLPATVELQLSSAAGDHAAVEALVRPAHLGALSAHGWVATAATHDFAIEWSLPEQSLAQLLEIAELTLPVTLEPGATLKASGRVEGTPSAPRGSAELDLRGVSLSAGSSGSWLAELPSARARLQWDGGHRLQLDLTPSAVHASGPGGAAIDGQLGAATAVAFDQRRFETSTLSLKLGELGTVRATAPRAVDSWQVEAQAPDLGAWLAVWPDLATRLPTGDHVSGALRVTGELALGSPTMSGSARFELHDAGWTAASFERVVEGLEGHGDVVLERAHDGSTTLRTKTELGGFQLLWDTLYGDYSAQNVSLSGSARLDPDGGWSGSWHGSVGQELDLALRASGSEGVANWWGSATSTDLAALWEQLVRGPCAGSLGELEKLSIRAGSARVGAEVRAAADTTLELHAAATELSLTVGNGIVIDGFQLDLPAALVRRDGRFEPGAVQHGELAVTALRMGGVELPGFRSSLTARGDDLHIDEPLVIPTLGGMLELDGLGLRDLLTADRHLEAAVELDGLKLEMISRALGLPRLDGRLEGHFPRLRLSPEQLSIDGAGELELFGGSLILHDISGDEPLSRYPRLTLAMAWENIDLGRLTSTFDFGRVFGLVEGEVEHCELFRGVPVRCSGWLTSTPTQGVEQRISMKAVNNIAIVGTGSGFGLLNRGIHRLIDSYPYETLGFSMRLENDHFLLRGLAHRGDKELFVKGRLPLRLDVVNAQPGTTVSFRSMLQRLRHLDFQTVRTEP